MKLSISDVKFLVRQMRRSDKEELGEDWVARCTMRQEAAMLLLNLGGYSVEHPYPFKVYIRKRDGNIETREYVE